MRLSPNVSQELLIRPFWWLTGLLVVVMLAGSLTAETVEDSLRQRLENAEGRDRCRLLNELAELALPTDPAEGIELARKSLALANSLSSRRMSCEALSILGKASIRNGEYQQALDYYRRELELLWQNQERELYGDALNGIGVAYGQMSDYDRALEYFLRALKVREALADSANIARSINNIGLLYSYLDDHHNSLKFHRRSLALKRKMKDQPGQATSLLNIGFAYANLDSLDRAIHFYDRSLALWDSIGDPHKIALNLNNLAMVYHKRQQNELALQTYHRALNISREHDDRRGVAMISTNIGEILFRTGQLDEALKYLTTGQEMAERIGAKSVLKENYRLLAEYHAAQYQFGQAYSYQQRYAAVKDSVLNAERSQQIVQLQTRYNNRHKERQIELLNRERELQELALARKNVINWVLLLLLVFGAMLVFFIFKWYRANKRLVRIQAARNTLLQNEIRDRKATEVALRKSERKNLAIRAALPDAILLVDAAGFCSDCNVPHTEHPGFLPDSLVNKPLTEHFPEKLVERFTNEIRQALQGSEVQIFEYSVKRLGKRRAFEARVAAFNEREALVVIRDITALRQSLDALRHAKEAAEAATRIKSEFLASMSHEIRTPMNAVIGMTSLMLDTELNGLQREYAATIRSSGETLLNIITEILDFSKLEADRIELEEQPFSLRQCVESVLDMFAVKAAQRNLDLLHFIEDDVPTFVNGDVTRVRQVLVNLVSNAIKFTSSGEVVIRIRQAAGENGPEIRFSVSDTGIGIEREKFAEIFAAFTQGDTSITRKYGGTGLGLAICRRLVKLMDGWIKVSSKRGEGATFTFAIPYHAVPELVSNAEPDSFQVLRGKRALIIDDNATNLYILTRQLQGWGVEVKALSLPQAALQLLKTDSRFDFAILDMLMPEMTGVELAHRIRSEHRQLELPLVLLSSVGRFDDKTQNLDHLFAATITKPVKYSMLLGTLRHVLSMDRKPLNPPARPLLDKTLGDRIPLRILLAEDNPVNQQFGLRLLEQMGYRADLAANGLEVLEAVNRQHYDLILMDVQMPEMDGLEATARIAAGHYAGRRPAIIALTGNALPRDRQICLDAGMDDYIAKPIQIELLQDKISEWGSKIQVAADPKH